jgi:hypothetical protein
MKTVYKSQHTESIFSQRELELVNNVTKLKENYYCCNLYFYNWYQREITRKVYVTTMCLLQASVIVSYV